MNAIRLFRPGLQDCALEDRLLPAISNLATIVLTTGGYVLMTPLPGVSPYPGNAPGGLSGTPAPTSFSISGSGGIGSSQPVNPTAVSNLAAAGTGAPSGGADAAGAVGSGANNPAALNI